MIPKPTKADREMTSIFLAGGRKSGRTRALMKAAEECPDCLVLVVDETQARLLKKQFPNVDVRSRMEPDRLLGLHKPILLDHYYLEKLWYERERELSIYIEELERRLFG